MTKKANKQQTKQTDKQTIVQHVKTSENKLNDLLANISKQVESVEVAKNKHAYKTATTFKKSKVATKSRRAYIIDLIHKNKYTQKQITAIITNDYDFADLKNNSKAVSGTLHDLKTLSTCNIKENNESDVISCVSENCKYRK